ncbi:MAG: DUF3291 domain-containing protein [Chthonomonadales bacterium]
MPRLAFTTFGVLIEPSNHPQSKGFVDRIEETYAEAEGCEGFIDRSVRDIKTWTHSWGEQVCPNFLDPALAAQIAQTVTIWDDLESVFAYSYTGFHAEGLKMRKEWFREPEYPNYAAWWVADDHQPTFAEATQKLEMLHAQGSTPESFSFKKPFDTQGNPAVLDQAVAKEKMKRNAALR